MGPPQVCAHCAKRFKVFAKRRKCTHCHVLLCRACHAPHVAERHPNVVSSGVGGLTGSSSNLMEGSYAGDDDDDIHFQSPIRTTSDSSFSGTNETNADSARRPPDESSVDLLDDLDGLDVVDVDDNEDEDEDDGGDEDLLLGEYSRRASMEEEETQFREFTQLQHAVDKWTRKEMALKRQRRLSKQNALVYATKPVPNFGSMREHQQRELFSGMYAVFVTLIVWAAFALVVAVARHFVVHTLGALPA